MSSESPYENFSNRNSYYDHEKQNAFDSGNYESNMNEGSEIDVIIDMREDESLLDENHNLSQRNFNKNKTLDRKFEENNNYLNYTSAKKEPTRSESNFYDKYPLISSNTRDSYNENSFIEISNTPNRKPRIIDDEYGPNNFLNKKQERSDTNEKESYDKKSEILRNLKNSANANNRQHNSPVFVSTFINSPNTKPKSELQSLINKTKIHHPKPNENKNSSFKQKFDIPQETICLDDEPQEQIHQDKSINPRNFYAPANFSSQISPKKENILVEKLKILEDRLDKFENDREKDREVASKSMQETSFKENNTSVANYSNTNNTLIKLFGAAMKLIIHIDETVNTKLESKCDKCEKCEKSEKSEKFPPQEKEQIGKQIDLSQNTEKIFTNKFYTFSGDKMNPPQIAEFVNTLYNSSYNSNLEKNSNFVYSSPQFISPVKELNFKEKSYNGNHHKTLKNKNDCYSKNQSNNVFKKANIPKIPNTPNITNISNPTNEELKTTLPPCMLDGIQSPNKSSDNSKNYNIQKYKCYNCGNLGHIAKFCYSSKN